MNLKIFSRVVLPILLIVYIGIETLLKLQDSSICSSVGCKLAGELLRFNSIYLNIIGMVGVSAILLAGMKSIKSELWDRLFFVMLYSAIAFESIMIAYQVLVNPEPCNFCMGVFGSLILIGVLANVRYFIYFLPVVFAIFTALSTLSTPRNEHLVKENGVYLIHSNKCPHCKNVKKYFKEHSINYQGIKLPSTTAKFFANVLGINQIPIILIKNNHNINVIYGDKPIIGFFEQNLSKVKARNEESKDSSILFKKDDDGCSINLTSDGGCSDNNKKGLR